MLCTLINELTCGHWTTVVFIELLVYIELTKKLICTCSPTLVLTKGTKAHQRKVSSARLIVYTAHFIRAGLDFQDRVPVLSVLGLPLDMVRARVKFWSGTDGPKSFTRLNLSMPNQFFWYAHFFHLSRAKNFRPCKWGLNSKLYDSGPPVVYQDLSMWHDWLVKKACCQILYQDERKFTETYLQLWLFISCIGGAEQRYQCCFTRLNYICNALAG